MNILITGGKGFIGKHVANKLSSEHNVTVLDNGFRKSPLKLSDGVNVIIGSITDKNLIDSVITGFDVVIHLGGISQVMTSIKNPEMTFEYNIKGTEIIANACYRSGVRLLFSSSREVYGCQDSLPVGILSELRPENPYAASKIAGEMIIRAYSVSYGLRFGIFRLSNVYGYGDSGRVLPIFINNALNGNDIQIYGNQKVIDFIHVDDVVDAIIKMLEVKYNFVVNIGSGVGHTLEDITKMISECIDMKSIVRITEARLGEVDRFIADISETKKIIDWTPKIGVDVGIKRLIEEMRV